MLDQIKEIKTKQIPQLLEIPKPPSKLYIKGTLPDPETHKYLTVVGSRKYSNYGKEVCEKLIQGLAGYPIVIISGLALGIDTIAHQSALANNLKTIAVPGSGLNDEVLYPRTNLRLANKIIEAGGCLLSEFEPDLQATPYTFPQRNRIMAGLADAVLVIEATEKSGTLITARLALDYNREVMTIPGSIFAPNSNGTNTLVRQGATLIRNSADILDSLGLEVNTKPQPVEKTALAPIEKIIYNLLLTDPLTKDELIIKSKIDASEINMTLSRLEMRGIITEINGEFHLHH